MSTILLLEACPRCRGALSQSPLDQLEFLCLRCGYLTWLELPPPQPSAAPKAMHYLYGWGTFGCLYDGCGCADTALEAAQSVAEALALGPTVARMLRNKRYMELGGKHNVDYAEIVECSCLHKEVHSVSIGI